MLSISSRIILITSSLLLISVCATPIETIPDFTIVGAIDRKSIESVNFEDLMSMHQSLEEDAKKIGAKVVRLERYDEEIDELSKDLDDERVKNREILSNCIFVGNCRRRELLAKEVAELERKRTKLSEEIAERSAEYHRAKELYFADLIDLRSRDLVELPDEFFAQRTTLVQSLIFPTRTGRETTFKFDDQVLPKGVEVAILKDGVVAQKFVGDDLYLRNGFSDTVDWEASELKISLIDTRSSGDDIVALKALFQEAIYIDVGATSGTESEFPIGELNEMKSKNEAAVGSRNEGLCSINASRDSRQPFDSAIIGQVVMFDTTAAGATPLGTAFRVEGDYVVSAGHVFADHLAEPLDADEGLDLQRFKERISYIQVWFRPEINVPGTPVNNAIPEHRFFIDTESIACAECVLDHPGEVEPADQPGDDWAVFKLKRNAVTKMTVSETFPDEPGIGLLSAHPKIDPTDQLYVMGFGISAKPRVNLKMQIAAGGAAGESFSPEGIPWIRHSVDTRRGSSGGPLIFVPGATDGSLMNSRSPRKLLANSFAIGVHVGGFCELNSSSALRRDNEAVSFSSPKFRRALEYRGLLTSVEGAEEN